MFLMRLHSADTTGLEGEDLPLALANATEFNDFNI